jgi:RNA polymerase subunit RPABC4/transcription elongation factor Spt4
MRAMILFKVCRECGEEYRPDVERCADCGGELLARFADGTGPAGEEPQPASGAAPAPEPVPLDDAGLRPVHVADRSEELKPHARALAEAGIRFAVRGSMYQFALLVRESDLPRAVEVLRPLIGPSEPVEEEDAAGPGACPACGHVLSQQAAECPGCGLVLAGPAARPCARCGRPVPPDARECAACGAAFE